MEAALRLSDLSTVDKRPDQPLLLCLVLYLSTLHARKRLAKRQVVPF